MGFNSAFKGLTVTEQTRKGYAILVGKPLERTGMRRGFI
jgi:hypothetical protein